MKSSLTNISTQFSVLYTIKSIQFSDQYINTIFPTYIQLNQQVTVSHKFISTIFPTYILLNQQVTVSHKFISTIFPTYILLNQQVTVSHKFISTIFPSYIRLNKQVTVSHKFINTMFLTYILLNQQVTVSQKSFHNRLNNESFPHIQKKLKYLLRRRSLLPGKGREGGNMLNKHLHKIQKNITAAKLFTHYVHAMKI